MKTKSMQKILAVIISGILVGLFISGNIGEIKSLLIRSNILRVEQHVSYVGLPYEQLVNTADVIFVGRLIEISPSKWNQDSGEYWSNDSTPTLVNIQYHTLRFEVSRFIVDKIGASNQKTIEITVLGPSLLDGNPDYNLQTGNEVLVFAGKTDLAWREGGTKPVIALKTAPSLSFFVRNPNGNYEGEIIHLLGKGQSTVDRISLPLPDLITQIQTTIGNPTTP